MYKKKYQELIKENRLYLKTHYSYAEKILSDYIIDGFYSFEEIIHELLSKSNFNIKLKPSGKKHIDNVVCFYVLSRASTNYLMAGKDSVMAGHLTCANSISRNLKEVWQTIITISYDQKSIIDFLNGTYVVKNFKKVKRSINIPWLLETQDLLDKELHNTGPHFSLNTFEISDLFRREFDSIGKPDLYFLTNACVSLLNLLFIGIHILILLCDSMCQSLEPAVAAGNNKAKSILKLASKIRDAAIENSEAPMTKLKGDIIENQKIMEKWPNI